jgi:hypothetical protein
MKSIFLSVFLGIQVFHLVAQRIDSLPFNLEKGLLIIGAKVNNTDSDWALDTGAGMSITTETFNEQAGLTPINKKQKVRDVNKNIQKIEQVIVPNLTIGSFTASTLKVATFNMPFLSCQKVQLLGQDFMKAYNWKFDFENNKVYISDKPFTPDPSMIAWDISFEKNRPFTQIKWGSQTIKCLIDFGYRGYLDLNENLPIAKETLEEKKKAGTFLSYRTNVMGLLSTEEKDIHYVLADSLRISNDWIYNLPVSISNYAGAKIGLHFFTSFSNTLIINNQLDKYYFSPKIIPLYARPPLDAGFAYDNGKLKIVDKNTSSASSASELLMGEEIKSVDGKRADDFGSYCALLSWRFGLTSPSVWVEKMDGTKIEVRRHSLMPVGTSGK